jgi:hypothetical protein
MLPGAPGLATDHQCHLPHGPPRSHCTCLLFGPRRRRRLKWRDAVVERHLLFYYMVLYLERHSVFDLVFNVNLPWRPRSRCVPICNATRFLSRIGVTIRISIATAVCRAWACVTMAGWRRTSAWIVAGKAQEIGQTFAFANGTQTAATPVGRPGMTRCDAPEHASSMSLVWALAQCRAIEISTKAIWLPCTQAFHQPDRRRTSALWRPAPGPRRPGGLPAERAPRPDGPAPRDIRGSAACGA